MIEATSSVGSQGQPVTTSRLVVTRPRLAFESYSSRALKAVQTLEPSVASARVLIGRAAERKAAGELNEATLKAELAAPNVVILLSEKLEALLTQATRAEDVLALHCVNTGAITLRSYADSTLQGVGYYPDDSQMAKKLVDQTLNHAKATYAAVVSALGDTCQRYGIQLPPEAPI
ncbi:MAG: hypothetical protein PHF60_02835 [Candidatus ainarchaeum sp.]|nr:hypothetical protein [Candidatus ainarchaeum sp.]